MTQHISQTLNPTEGIAVVRCLMKCLVEGHHNNFCASHVLPQALRILSTSSVIHWIAMFSATAAFRLPLRRVQLSATAQAANTPQFRQKSSWTCDDNCQPRKLVEKSRKRKYEGAAEETDDKRVGSELPSQPAVARRVIKVTPQDSL